MARAVGRLSSLAFGRLKDPGMYPDGGGLYLQISRLGGRSWLFRFKAGGRERWMGLGPASLIGLAEARRAGRDKERLDTLSSMVEAIALYGKAGFVPIKPYYDTPVAGTIFLGRPLTRYILDDTSVMSVRRLV
jgi:hypothetical protein